MAPVVPSTESGLTAEPALGKVKPNGDAATVEPGALLLPEPGVVVASQANRFRGASTAFGG